MTNPYPVTVDPRTGLPLIRLSGRVDALSAGTVQDALTAIIDEGERKLLVDLSQVGFLSSAGIRSLLIVQKQLHGSSGELIMVAPNEGVRRVFETTRLTELFTLVEDLTSVPAPSAPAEAEDSEETRLELEGITVHVRRGEAGHG